MAKTRFVAVVACVAAQNFYSMRLRNIFAVALLIVGVVLQPLGWMYASWLAVISFAAIVAGAVFLQFEDSTSDEGADGTSDRSRSRDMPGDIHGHSGQLSGGRSTAWESNHSGGGDGGGGGEGGD